MGLKEFLSNKIKVEDLERGDHIYSWRILQAYAHHGVYVGNGEVIHFLAASDKSSSSSRRSTRCEKCIVHANTGRGVAKSCVPCFLGGGRLYRCKYEASPIVKNLRRPGTCTTRKASPVETIVYRAEYLLNQKVGFGKYDLLKRNCKDFALYCRLGIVGVGKGLSSQVARVVGVGQGLAGVGQGVGILQVGLGLVEVGRELVDVGRGLRGQEARLTKTMPRVKEVEVPRVSVREVEVEDLVAELQAETQETTTHPAGGALIF